MKTFELFESTEDKNGSVSISMHALTNRKHVTVNIDYRDINEYTRGMSLSDPNNPELQEWALERASKTYPEIRNQLEKFRQMHKKADADIEAEVLEMVGAFKALINAMILEKQNNLMAAWTQLVAQYADDEEYKANLK